MIGRIARLFGGALLAGVLWCHAADLHRVAGVVVNAQTGAPLPGARVVVVEEGTQRQLAGLATGSDGRFSFDLPQGRYRLLAGLRDALDVYGQSVPEVLSGSLVIAGPGQNTSNLVFRWFPRGAISGRIVDEVGEPVVGAQIQLTRSTIMAGRRVGATAAWGQTDDRGEYRFGPLPGGAYYLAVTAKPWYSEMSSFGQPDAVTSAAYAPAYYPDTIDAAPLLLKPGEEVRADFTLRVFQGASVSVEFDIPQAVSGIVVLLREGVGGTEWRARQEYVNVGKRVIRDVSPGHYLVRLTGASTNSPVVAQQWIDVGGTDVTVQLSPRPAPVVSGAVEWKGQGPKPQGAILVSLLGIDAAYTMPAAVRPDGTFSFPDVPVGRYRVVAGLADGNLASEIHVEGAGFREGVLDLAPGASVTLRMVVSGDMGRLQGFVMRGEQPADAVLVVLAPAQDTTNPFAYYGYQTESDGSFDYQNVPAGDYFLFAADEPRLEYTNPAAIRPYLTNAKRIRIQPSGSYSERIPLAERPAPSALSGVPLYDEQKK
jgi:hypothetical protein